MEKTYQKPPTQMVRVWRKLTGATLKRTEREWRIIVALVLFMALFSMALLLWS